MRLWWHAALHFAICNSSDMSLFIDMPTNIYETFQWRTPPATSIRLAPHFCADLKSKRIRPTVPAMNPSCSSSAAAFSSFSVHPAKFLSKTWIGAFSQTPKGAKWCKVWGPFIGFPASSYIRTANTSCKFWEEVPTFTLPWRQRQNLPPFETRSFCWPSFVSEFDPNPNGHRQSMQLSPSSATAA